MAARRLEAREKAFARHYVVLGNATKAAAAAGYSPHTAKQAGSRLLHRGLVLDEIARLERLKARIVNQLLVSNLARPARKREKGASL
jgi:phage terminase small subunit